MFVPATFYFPKSVESLNGEKNSEDEFHFQTTEVQSDAFSMDLTILRKNRVLRNSVLVYTVSKSYQPSPTSKHTTTD